MFLFVLAGGLRLGGPALGTQSLAADESCVLPRGLAFTLEASGDLEMLEVTLPAELPPA
jgi:hypothetical protein